MQAAGVEAILCNMLVEHNNLTILAHGPLTWRS